MATQTTHYGLAKPVKAEDNALISSINGNMDILDSALNNLTGSVAIIQRTDTATQAISKNDFVIWKGSLYKASSNIALGDTLSVSNLTAVSGGGLNNATGSSLEIIAATEPYNFTGDELKEYRGAVLVRRSSLNGKKILGVGGFNAGSSHASCVSCIYYGGYETIGGVEYASIDFELYNLSYPTERLGLTFRVDLLVG